MGKGPNWKTFLADIRVFTIPKQNFTFFKKKKSYGKDSQTKLIISKLTIEKLEKGKKLFKVNNKNTRPTSMNGNFEQVSHLF